MLVFSLPSSQICWTACCTWRTYTYNVADVGTSLRNVSHGIAFGLLLAVVDRRWILFESIQVMFLTRHGRVRVRVITVGQGHMYNSNTHAKIPKTNMMTKIRYHIFFVITKNTEMHWYNRVQ